MSDSEIWFVVGFLLGAFQVGLVIALLALSGADERFVGWLERVQDRMEGADDEEDDDV